VGRSTYRTLNLHWGAKDLAVRERQVSEDAAEVDGKWSVIDGMRNAGFAV
jgi:hypothetical protein